MSLLLWGRWDEAERDRWLAALQQHLPGEHWLLAPPENAADAAAVEAAIVANPAPASLGLLPNLRLVQSVWAGVERLLADAALPQQVPLARMVDPAMNEAMAQTALWAVTALHRGFFAVQAQQQQALWQAPVQTRAQAWRVLVLGMGELGRRVASALQAQGYAVSGYGRRELQARGEGALVEALARADTVINLMPLTAETTGFFDAPRLAQFKRGASLVNLARGAHMVESDLLAALDAGQLGHAVLDVFSTEPLPADHAFWRHPHVTVLPHTAAQTDPDSASAVVATNVRALRAGRPLLHMVDRARGY